MRRSVPISSVVAVVALLASEVRAQPSGAPTAEASRAAERHRAAGDKHYEANQLAAAIDEYRRAYAFDPRPEFLFSLARLESERDDCAAAISYYRQFLATSPGPKARQRTLEAIAACETELASSPPKPTPSSPGEPAPPTPATDSGSLSTSVAPAPGPASDLGDTLAGRADETSRRGDEPPWYRDALGASLLGGGAVAGLAAGGLYFLARRDIARAEEGGTGGIDLDEYERLTERADSRQWYAAIAGGVGVALVVGGIVRFATRDHNPTSNPAIAISVRRNALTVCGQF